MAGSFKFDLKKVLGKVIAKATIDVPCPECGVKNRVKGEDISRERTFTCRGCHRSVKMHDKGDGFAKIIRGR